MFELTRQLLLDDMLAVDDAGLGLSKALTLTYPWSFASSYLADASTSPRSCDYLMYMQQERLTPPGSVTGEKQTALTPAMVELIEREMRFPDGAPIPYVPKLAMSAVIFSPDCGVLLRSQNPPRHGPDSRSSHLQGHKLEAHLRRLNHYTMVFASICGAQIWVLIRQMKDASTPSTVSRVSVYTIAMMALGDGFACMALTLGVFAELGFLVVISTAFLASMSVSFFGMKFLMEIWTVQAPERRERQRRSSPSTREIPSTTDGREASSAGVTLPSSAATHELPPPVTAPRVSSNAADIPVILPPDQDLDAAEAEDAEMAAATNEAAPAAGATATPTGGTTRRETAALYSRFYLVLLGLIVLSLQSTAWPSSMRSLYLYSLSFVYLSFWTPQIYRNVMRNCRKGLRWEFVISQSLLRLAPVIYLCTTTTDDNNILIFSIEPEDGNSSSSGGRRASVLIGWIWIQVWILLGQQFLGPRFFVPESWLPPAYDYHPVLREDDLENGDKMPLGFSLATESTSSTDDTGPARSTFTTATTTSTSTSTAPGAHVDEAKISMHAHPGPSSATRPTKPRSSHSPGYRIFDCAICMQNIEVPILPLNTSSSTSTSTSTSTDPSGSVPTRNSESKPVGGSSSISNSSSSRRQDREDREENSTATAHVDSRTRSSFRRARLSAGFLFSSVSSFVRLAGSFISSSLSPSPSPSPSFSFSPSLSSSSSSSPRSSSSPQSPSFYTSITSPLTSFFSLSSNTSRLSRARASYMVTPCRHIFHTECLEGWMRYRLQCPICREGLVPL